MSNAFSRRNFLKSFSVGAGLVLGGAVWPIQSIEGVEPFKRPGSPRMFLSLAAYSFRDYFVDSSHRREKESDPTKRIDMLQFIDYCADHGCVGAELTSYYFPASITHEYLIALKQHAFMRGVEISGTAVGNNFTLAPGAKRDAEIKSVKQWIDYAQIMGAPHIRVFAGTADKQSKADAQKRCIEAFQECADYAASKGIMLGLENHGGIVAEPDGLLEIVHAVKSSAFGINLDTGNFHTADPYADLAKIAPYAVNVQIKLEVQAQGHAKEPADLARAIQILRDANYQGYVALEYESSEDPWQAVPPALKKISELIKS